MFTPLLGRSVIVTGGSKGIGNGIARVLGTAGANVLIVSRNQGEADAAAKLIRDNGGSASGFAADMRRSDGCNGHAASWPH